MSDPTLPTPEKDWRIKFLDALQMHGIVTRAALEAGVHRDTAYFERSKDEWFASEWTKALERGVDMLEDVARQRAYEGSDTLLIFLLKAHRPDVYRETTRTISVNVTPDDLRTMSDDDLDDLEKQLRTPHRR